MTERPDNAAQVSEGSKVTINVGDAESPDATEQHTDRQSPDTSTGPGVKPATQSALHLARTLAEDPNLRPELAVLAATLDSDDSWDAQPAPTERLVEHFVLGKLLGEGGMGRVFRGHDISLDRPVALKKLSRVVDIDSPLAGRFVREARAQARLNHPNVVGIYYIGISNGQYFFAMELVDGEPLDVALERGEKLSWDKALDTLIVVADALKAAQAAGFIHRDIKPSNLLRTRDGRVKVADFGLARPLEEAGSAPGTFVGTPLYASPEQARGEGTDHRSDMYALGATIFHMVTGRPVFTADSVPRLLEMHISAPPPGEDAFPDDVPLAFRRLVLRLLRKIPNARFMSWDEVIKSAEAVRPARFHPGGLLVRLMSVFADVAVVALGVALLKVVGATGLAVLGFVLGYFWFSIAGTGRTPGQYAFRLRVVDARNETPGLWRSLLRTVSSMWGLLSAFAVTLLWAVASGNADKDLNFSVNPSTGSTSDFPPYINLVVVIIIGAWLLSLLWIAFKRSKIAMHDRWSKTRVVYDIRSRD